MEKPLSEMNSEEYAAYKAAHRGGTLGEAQPEPAEEKPIEAPAEEPPKEEEPEKEPEPKVEAEPEKVEPQEPAPSEDEPEPEYVPLHKFMEQKRLAREKDDIIEKLREENKRISSAMPKDARDALVEQRINELAGETGGDPAAVKKLVGVVKEALGVDAEVLADFQRQREQKLREDAAAREKSEREKTLSRTFDKELKQALDADGITDPATIATLKKTIIEEALSLPPGVPLVRVYRSSDAREQYLEKPKPVVKPEKSRGGVSGTPTTPKNPKDMSSEEWQAEKAKRLGQEPIEVLRTGPSGNLKKVRLN